jgi:serine/threonine protein kinase
MQVKSPYVVEVYDVRVLKGTPVIIMELVQGPSAADRIDQGALPIHEALRIGEHVAKALQVAEEAGVVHRDVKPHNILLSPTGEAKLSDFGLAKQLGASHLTVKGMGLGSLHYAAPEQIEDAAAVDSRTDLYGLGASLYHMIAGEPLFAGGDLRLLELIERIIREEPTPLHHLRPDCPRDVSLFVLGLLAKAADDRRPQHFKHVVARLQELRSLYGSSAALSASGERRSLEDTFDDDSDLGITYDREAPPTQRQHRRRLEP